MHKPAVADTGAGTRPWWRKLRPTAIVRRAARAGRLGLAASLASVAACYGVLAVVSLLAFIGVAIPVDARLWAGRITCMTVLAPLALAWNAGVHRNIVPPLLGAAGAVLVVYAVLGRYDWRVEALGFVALLAAALLDRHLFRRALGC